MLSDCQTLSPSIWNAFQPEPDLIDIVKGFDTKDHNFLLAILLLQILVGNVLDTLEAESIVEITHAAYAGGAPGYSWIPLLQPL